MAALDLHIPFSRIWVLKIHGKLVVNATVQSIYSQITSNIEKSLIMVFMEIVDAIL